MKKVFLFVALAFSAGAFAQSTSKEDVDIIQGLYGKSKKELVAAYMTLTEAQATGFWKLYEEYEVKRKKLGKEKIDIINEYGANLMTLTQEEANKLAEASLKNNMAFEKLYQEYYRKNKSIVGAINAAQFIQLEVYLATVIRAEIQDAIPFIGQIDQTKKPEVQN